MSKTEQLAPTPPAGRRIHLPDGSRSTRSPWVWRGWFFMSLIALGLCLTLASGGQTAFAGCWGAIALGWFAISMWLWRQTVRNLD